MTLLTPIALLGLLLLPGLVALHLHRRHLHEIEIPSLLLWEDLVSEPASGGRRRHVEYVLLLLLQSLVVCALVLGLAQSASTSTARGSQVYVLDRGALMTVAEPAPLRFDAARSLVKNEIQAVSPGTTLTIILADAQPSVLVSTTDSGLATHLLTGVQPVAAAPDLKEAVTLGMGFLGLVGHLQVVYAMGDVLPRLTAPTGLVSLAPIGGTTDNQAVSQLSVRCLPGATSCTALAALRNAGGADVQEDVVIEADGTVLGRQPIRVPADSDTDLSFSVPATHHVVELYLTRPDLVSADNLAWSIIPGYRETTVTIVGDAAHTAPIARALSAIPNVRSVVRTPSQYGTVASGVPGLLILAGWMPSGALPATPSLLLVDPPRFPGASAPKTLTDTGVSNEDDTSTLLAGVDLTSLDIPHGAGEQLTLPQELHPVVSAASAPLIAAGVLDGRHLVTMALSPTASNLSQLDAFPVLMANILQWSADWLPSNVSPGGQLAIDPPPATTSVDVSYTASLNSPMVIQKTGVVGNYALADIALPGLYTITEHGAWGVRSTQIAANVGTEVRGASLVVSRSLGHSTALEAATLTTLWWPWLGLIAALALAVEWLLVLLNIGRRR